MARADVLPDPHMNATVAVAGLTAPEKRHIGKWGRVTAAEVICCVAIAAAASVSMALALGRDLNWDFFNYHLYAGLLLTQGRLSQDFMAAGYQGYMNPLAYLPLYWMATAKWHSMVIASVIAVIQSLNFVFLYLIARRVIGAEPYPRLSACLITVLGACSGVVLGQLGSSFIDFSTASPVLAALWLLLLPTTTSRLVLAGALLGLATGLKLTNIVFVVGAAAMASGLPTFDWRPALRRLTLLGVGVAAGALISYGYWGYQLQQNFGSPVFPMFNQVFKAPDFPAVAIQYHRFLPTTFLDLISLPLQMIGLESWIYVETQAPDLRPLTLLVILGALGVRAVRRYGRAMPVDATHSTGFERLDQGALGSLGLFIIAAVIVWVPTSSNGRYATPILLLLGPVIYLASRKLTSHKRSLMICLVLLAAQAVHTSSAGNPRWNAKSWTDEWLPAEVPYSLRDEPHLFLTIGTSSESYLAAFVHPDSAFANPIGLMSIANDGPSWPKLQRLMDQHANSTQLVFSHPMGSVTVEQRAELDSRRKAIVERLGLTFDSSSCQTLVFDAAKDDSTATARSASERPRRLLSCAAERLLTRDQALAAARNRAATIMNAIEDRCPHIFSPRRAQVEGDGNMWARLYGKYDLYLAVNFKTTEVFFRMEHQRVDTMIGQVNSIDRDVKAMRCALPRDGHRGL